MKVARFMRTGEVPRLGVVEGEEIIDFTARRTDLSGDVLDYLRDAPNSWRLVRSVLEGAPKFALSEVTLLAPVPRPRKFLALGANYQSHLREVEHLNLKVPPYQLWVSKQVTCVNDPFGDVVIPRVSNTVDFEGELAVVIGRTSKNLTREDSMKSVAGYMVCDDFSVREWQLRTPTMMLGKSFDTHGPIGPWIVTADEVVDPHNLRIRTWVNGVVRQDESTAGMIYPIWDQLMELSSVFTLEPGDIITTGTPAGVGAAKTPPQFLRPGDRVRVEIDRIGTIENKLVGAEQC